MSTKKSAGEMAADRYPDPGQPMAERLGLIPDYKRRNDFQEAFATCIREEVEPLEAENAKLRALVQELTKAGDVMSECIGQIAYELEEGWELTGSSNSIVDAEKSAYRWTAAKELGFVPTNTTEG